MTQEEAAEHIYMQHSQAKRTWRRFTGRPVRRFRRHLKFHKRRKGKGEGRSKAKRGGFTWTQGDALAYLKGKGKGHRLRSTGKGFGRRKNPRDRNGNLMKCHNCGSEDRLVARCPQKGRGKGGKTKGIDFTAFASPGEGDPAAAPVDRVFAEPTPSPWDE